MGAVRPFFLTLFLGITSSALAYPLYSPRPVPSAIAGPTDPHVAAVFYNPAALGPLRGYHFYLDGGARLQFGSIRLEGSSESVSAFAPSFDGFFGASWDLANDYVTAAVAIYSPLNEFPNFGVGPTRYHQIFSRFAMLEETLAVAVRLISQRLYVGVGVNIAEVWLDSSFARAMEPAKGEDTIRLRGFNKGPGFSLGILAAPIPKLWIGASFSSHIFSQSGNDIWLNDVGHASVQVAGNDPIAINDVVVLATPELFQAAARGEIHPRVELEAAMRYVHYRARPHALDVTLTGNGIPPPTQFAIDLGLQDTFAVEASGRFRIAKSLRLSPSFVYESSAVQADHVSAAALGADKFDVTLTAEWTPVTHLRLGAHVGAVATTLGRVNSAYKPGAQAECYKAFYDLQNPYCQQVVAGDALPSADGNYSIWMLHFGASIAADFW